MKKLLPFLIFVFTVATTAGQNVQPSGVATETVAAKSTWDTVGLIGWAATMAALILFMTWLVFGKHSRRNGNNSIKGVSQ